MFCECDRSRAVDVVVLNFRKAFDKVSHKRLMRKVRALGIQGNVAAWIKNWLAGRRQRVIVNSVPSDWTAVSSGVPQGSVLGRLLFVIYINDLNLGLFSKVSKFTDDTKLGINAANPESVRALHRDLAAIGEWSTVWQINKQMVLALYRALVKPLLEYGAQFWSPIRRVDVERLELEKVQARATKLVPSIRHKRYQRRLADLGLFTLKQRRLRGLLIETFRFLEVSVGWTRSLCLNCP